MIRWNIGEESGSIHVAATIGTPAFYLAGMWDEYRFLPYKQEKIDPWIKEPICIYRNDIDVEQLSYANCNSYGKIGYGNKICSLLCRKKQPCLCLQSVQVKDVFEVIESAFKV